MHQPLSSSRARLAAYQAVSEALIAKHHAIAIPHNEAYIGGLVGYDEYMTGAKARLVAFTAENDAMAAEFFQPLSA
jgi:hypothetical protein